jgi:alkylhydroperoxidase family enzyme
MAWIRVIGPEEADGELSRAYEATGGLGTRNMHRVMSLNPTAMEASRHLSDAVTRGGSCLGRVREELIAVVVAAHLGCPY